jgi:hypothetical protein
MCRAIECRSAFSDSKSSDLQTFPAGTADLVLREADQRGRSAGLLQDPDDLNLVDDFGMTAPDSEQSTCECQSSGKLVDLQFAL